MRAEYGTYAASNYYYGYVHNGEKFKSTAGVEHSYLYPYSSTESNSSTALYHAASFVCEFLRVPSPTNPNTVGNFTFICCHDDDYNDSKYTTTNVVSGISLSWSASYPGSTILTLTNTTTTSKTLNAILMRKYCRASDSASNYGDAFYILTGGILLEEDVTIPPGGTYAITLTV